MFEHKEARSKHEKGTCHWIFDHQEYQDWISRRIPHLWIHGPVGCCKTILCSTIVEDCKERLAESDSTALIYFYFTFQDIRKQDYQGFLLSVVSQLCCNGLITPELESAHAKNQKHPDDLEKAAISLLGKFESVFLFVDGLDECPELDAHRTRQRVLDGLQRLGEIGPGLKLLMTSRNEMDIREHMHAWSITSMAIKENNVNQDINKYVENELLRDKKLSRLPDPSMIQAAFRENSGGMYVKC